MCYFAHVLFCFIIWLPFSFSVAAGTCSTGPGFPYREFSRLLGMSISGIASSFRFFVLYNRVVSFSVELLQRC